MAEAAIGVAAAGQAPELAGATELSADPHGGFEDWYRREHPKVLAALIVVSGSVELAQEATDEAFARALARWPRVRGMASPGGWLYTVALNLVRRQAKRSSHEARLRALIDADVVTDGPEREIWDVVLQLPARQRAAVVLRYLVDMSEKEIAEVMGIAPGTVGATLFAARRNLARWLSEEDPT